jgi:hypothetical protein
MNKKPKKRARTISTLYREAVEWIALNDDPGSPDSLSPYQIADYISTSLVADIFRKSRAQVALDIMEIRRIDKGD